MDGLSVAHLAKAYRGQEVLRDLNITAAKGEFVTLLGPSGCGKTTTLRCIAGLETPDSGEITLAGRTLCRGARSVVPPEKRRIGLVFQSYAVWPHLSVAQNVAFPLKMQRAGAARIRREVTEVLDLVGLAGRANARIDTLSGGQQQRVGLARALIARPDLLLFDEPLSNLDTQLREQLRDEIARLRSTYETTAVYVTHDQSEAMALSDTIYLMDAGRIAQAGSPAELYTRPSSITAARFVGFDNFESGTVIDSQPHGLVTVRLDSTAEQLVGAGSAPTGTRVVACFRSTVARVATEGGEHAAPSNRLSGTLSRYMDLGDVLEWRIARSNGAEIRVRLPRSRVPSDRFPNVGDAVEIFIDRADTRVLTSEPELHAAKDISA